MFVEIVIVLVIVHSQPTVMSTSTSSHRYFVNESSIPPTTPFLNQTSIFTEKPSKLTLKKHLNKNNVTTPSPVIDQNFTFPSVDNDTLIMTNQSYFDNDTLQELVERNISQSNLSAAGITGITVGCIGIVGIVCGVSFIVYNRNRGLNRPQVLNDRCSNPDSSGYIDDASIRVM